MGIKRNTLKTEGINSDRTSPRNSELTQERNNTAPTSTRANMSALYSIVVLVCVFITVSHACFSCPSCPETDLQRDFCAAVVVMSAKILSGPRQEVTPNDEELSEISSYDPDDVYSVKIIKIFKGEENVTALPGIHTVGVRSPSLIVDFHSPAKWWAACIPSLKALEQGHEYLLSGYILEGKLRSSYCDVRQSWSSVTHQQRKGLKGQYNENC